MCSKHFKSKEIRTLDDVDIGTRLSMTTDECRRQCEMKNKQQTNIKKVKKNCIWGTRESNFTASKIKKSKC